MAIIPQGVGEQVEQATSLFPVLIRAMWSESTLMGTTVGTSVTCACNTEVELSRRPCVSKHMSTLYRCMAKLRANETHRPHIQVPRIAVLTYVQDQVRVLAQNFAKNV